MSNGKPLKGGYGAVNEIGLVCHISLILAQKCGIKSKLVDDAVARSNATFRKYIDRGTVLYSTRNGVTRTLHDDNGKCSMAAIAFGIQGINDAREYDSKMAIFCPAITT